MQTTTERLFTDAHTQYGYRPTPVDDAQLRAQTEAKTRSSTRMIARSTLNCSRERPNSCGNGSSIIPTRPRTISNLRPGRT